MIQLIRVLKVRQAPVKKGRLFSALYSRVARLWQRPRAFKAPLLALFLACFFPLLTPLLGAVPLEAVYLTWAHNPSHSMVIRWITLTAESSSLLYFQKEGEEVWHKVAEGRPGFEAQGAFFHAIELQDLDEDQRYLFRIGEEGEIFVFRTLPLALSRPLCFAIGGDALYNGVLFRQMNEQIASKDPDFVVVGGDIAYTINSWKGALKKERWEVERWVRFFREWQRDFVGKEKRLIPILPVVGNHDVRGTGSVEGAPNLFYKIFSFPEEGLSYRSFDCGNYLSLVLLDTGHTSAIGGKQKEWLEMCLRERAKVPFKMAVYHVAAFPSYYDYAQNKPTRIRQDWVPLFEKYRVSYAFEHHNHCYKRTKPIRSGKVDPQGVVYIGDGSWGVPPRTPKRVERTWYLEKALEENTYSLVTLQKEGGTIEPRSITGELIDEVLPVKPSAR